MTLQQLPHQPAEHADLSSLATSGRVARLLAAVTATHRHAAIVLVLLSLACFLPGLASLQPMDRDEPRFAQAAKQMLETGDLVDIRFQDDARLKKPVGIYWLQAGAVALGEALGVPSARRSIWLYRLPSLLGAIGVVLATYWAALAFVGRSGAFLAAAMMAASILLGVEARLAKTDAVQALCATLMFGGLARAYLQRDRDLAPAAIAAFWIGTAFGILVKGPIVLMIAGLAVLALAIKDRSIGWFGRLRPGLGILAVAVLVLPWFIAIMAKSGGAFFKEAVGRDMLAKVGSGQERHGAPPGFYFLAFFGTFWPGAALAAIAAPFAWATRREAAVAFCLAWIIPSWLVFEAVPTKLPHYVLPLYPAIAILIVHVLVAGGLRRWGAVATALLIPFIPLAMLLGLSAAGWKLDGVPPFAGLPLIALALALAAWAWFAFRARDPAKAIVVAVVSSIALSAGVFGLAQQQLRSLKLSPRLAEAAAKVACRDPKVATVSYREPSLVFLVGTDLALLTAPDAAAFMGQGGCRIAFVGKPEEALFKAALPAGLQPALVTRVAGFNINSGRKADIAVYAVTP